MSTKKIMQDLLPDMGQLREFARHLFASRDQGPLYQLGLEVEDIPNIQALPKVRRARDYRVHDFSGKRYLDLYRGEGFSLLGYSLPGFQLAIKNRVSQALWQGLPHPLLGQLQKRLAQFFPDHHAVVCPDRYRVNSVLELLDVEPDRPLMPFQSDVTGLPPGRRLGYWLPFSGKPGPLSIALIPSLGVQGPYVLLVESKLFQHHLTSFGKHEGEVFHVLDFVSHQVPVFALSALMSSLSALEGLGAFAGLAALPASGDKLALGALKHPRTKDLNQQLGVWRESQWQQVSLGRWSRHGPYLVHDFSPAAYCRVFQAALRAGVVLNPRSKGVNCLPGIMSPGERKALESILALAAEEN